MPDTTSPTGRECPTCGETITTNYKKHIKDCHTQYNSGGSLPAYLSPENIKNYLSEVAIKNPRCPICNHSHAVAITKELLSGVSYPAILLKYGKWKSQPRFNKNALSTHKKHLNIDTITVSEIAKISRERGVGTPKPDNKSLNMMNCVSAAVAIKGEKIRTLEMMQIAKITVAKKLYDAIEYRFQIGVLDKPKDTVGDPAVDIPPPKDTATEYMAKGMWGISSKELLLLYRDYMDSISDTQVKMMKFYDNVPTPGNIMNSQLLYRVIKTHELQIIQYIIETIADENLRLKIAQEVGSQLNAMNSEIGTLFANNTDVTAPVDTIYEEFKTKFCNTEE